MNKINFVMCSFLLMLASASQAGQQQIETDNQISMTELGGRLEVGDVVFVRIPYRLFTKVADTTLSWTNHVGIVVDVSGTEPVIAESRFPLSGQTSWSRFVARSEGGRVAVARLPVSLDEAQRIRLIKAAKARAGILYDTGFDLYSRRQFCSRYVREVLEESVGTRVGQIEDFSSLLSRNPQTDLTFWKRWYLGYIPWQRKTVSPASLLLDPQMHRFFDGYAITNREKLS